MRAIPNPAPHEALACRLRRLTFQFFWSSSLNCMRNSLHPVGFADPSFAIATRAALESGSARDGAFSAASVLEKLWSLSSCWPLQTKFGAQLQCSDARRWHFVSDFVAPSQTFFASSWHRRSTQRERCRSRCSSTRTARPGWRART